MIMPPPTALQLSAARKKLGVSREEFAARLNTPLRTLDGWMYGKITPPPCLTIALKHIVEGELPDA